jgi:hypothetical protein
VCNDGEWSGRSMCMQFRLADGKEGPAVSVGLWGDLLCVLFNVVQWRG